MSALTIPSRGAASSRLATAMAWGKRNPKSPLPAAGVALIVSIAMLVAGVLLRHSGLALVSAALAGALLGFLRFNFYRASIFLGDCGSLTIGFLLGCCAIVWSNESATRAAPSPRSWHSPFPCSIRRWP